MASEDVGTLVARLVMDQEQFRSDMLKMTRQLESNTAKMNTALSRVDKGLAGLRKGFQVATQVAAAFGVALSARALINFTAQAINSAAELHNLSIRLNASVESLSALQYVARITDVDFGSLTKALQIMTRTVGQAVTVGGEAAKTFEMLGLSAQSLSGMTVDQQFVAVADALSRYTDESVRAAVGQRVFGRSFADVLQAMEGGAGAIGKLVQEAEDLGLILGADAAARADEAKDSMDRLAASSAVLAREFGIILAPAIQLVTDRLREMFFPTRSEELREELDRRREEVERLQRLLESFQARAATAGPIEKALDWITGVDVQQGIAETTAALTEARIELELLQAAADRKFATGKGTVAGAAADAAAAGTPPGLNVPQLARGGDFLAGAERMAAAARGARGITESLEDPRELQELSIEEFKKGIDAKIAERQRYSTAAGDALLAEMQMEQQVAQETLNIRAGVTDAAIGLLSALGSEHRGAAIAALAIEKFRAVREILMRSQSAAWLARATIPFPAGEALAKKYEIGGKIQAGLVAATGLVEAAQLSHGGTRTTLGTSANPLTTRETSQAGGAGSIAKQSLVQVHIGALIGWDDAMKSKLVGAIREATEGRDMVIFGPNSRQMEVIRGSL